MKPKEPCERENPPGEAALEAILMSKYKNL